MFADVPWLLLIGHWPYLQCFVVYILNWALYWKQTPHWKNCFLSKILPKSFAECTHSLVSCLLTIPLIGRTSSGRSKRTTEQKERPLVENLRWGVASNSTFGCALNRPFWFALADFVQLLGSKDPHLLFGWFPWAFLVSLVWSVCCWKCNTQGGWSGWKQSDTPNLSVLVWLACVLCLALNCSLFFIFFLKDLSFERNNNAKSIKGYLI